MAIRCLFGILAACAIASAADLHVTVRPGQVADTQITLSKADLLKQPVLWVQADPNQIEVNVTSPDGRIHSALSFDASAPVSFELADHGSSSSNEVSRAQLLGSDATLVGWNEKAPVGTYKIRLAGKVLSSPVHVTLRQITADDLRKEIEAKAKAREQQFVASFFAGPVRLAPTDAHGNASLTFTGSWQKDDVILIGSTLEGAWDAAVRLPDGTTITEANARKSDCEWSALGKDDTDDLSLAPWAQKVKGVQRSVNCPGRMKSGSITITLHANGKSPGTRLVAAVVRFNALGAAFEKELKQLAEAPKTVALFHKVEDPGQMGFLSAIVDRPVVIRLALAGGASPVAEAAVTGIAYTLDPKSKNPLSVFGPDPEKKPYGAAAKIAREPNGDFVYNFSSHQPATHQLDFRANGVFRNGRRFEADTIVTVFVHRRAATLNGVRQRRIDRNTSGKADVVRFLLDLDVAEPGAYEAHIQVGNQPNESWYAYANVVLEAGKQTMAVDGGPKFVAKLEENPDAQLRVRVTNRNPRKDGDFPSEVAIDMAMPKAGEFESPAAGRSGTTGTGATWRISGTDLALTIPVTVTGTGCQWAATLGINPRKTLANQLIRPVGYRQSGTFVPLSGRVGLDSRWNLEAFFAAGPAPGKQAFVFRLKEARCGENRGSVVNFEGDAESGDDVYATPFTVDLDGLQFAPLTDNGTAGAPRIAGLATIEPLDKDGDGKFDHLKASFDMVSPGGTCLWWSNVGVEGMATSTTGHAKTKPGVNRVSMELDVTSGLSLRDQPVFSFNISRIKCGVNPEFTREEMESAFIDPMVLFEEEFAVDSSRFAGRGEFKFRRFAQGGYLPETVNHACR